MCLLINTGKNKMTLTQTVMSKNNKNCTLFPAVVCISPKNALFSLFMEKRYYRKIVSGGTCLAAVFTGNSAGDFGEVQNPIPILPSGN